MADTSGGNAARLTELNQQIHDEIARGLEAGAGQLGDEDRARILLLVEEFLRLDPGTISATGQSLTPDEVLRQLVGAVQRETTRTQEQGRGQEAEEQGTAQRNAGLAALRAQVEQLPDESSQKPLILAAIDAYGRQDYSALQRTLNLLGVPFKVETLQTFETDAEGRPLPPEIDVASIPLLDEFSAVIGSLVTAATPAEERGQLFTQAGWDIDTGEQVIITYRRDPSTGVLTALDPKQGPLNNLYTFSNPEAAPPKFQDAQFFNREGVSSVRRFFINENGQTIFVDDRTGIQTPDTGEFTLDDPTLAAREATALTAAAAEKRTASIQEAISQIQARFVTRRTGGGRVRSDFNPPEVFNTLMSEMRNRAEAIGSFTASEFRSWWTEITGSPLPQEFEPGLAQIVTADPAGRATSPRELTASQRRDVFEQPGRTQAPSAGPTASAESSTAFQGFPVAIAQGVGTGVLSQEDADEIWGAIFAVREAHLGPNGFDDLGLDVEGTISSFLGLVNRGVLSVQEASAQIRGLADNAIALQQTRREEERRARGEELDIRQQEFLEEREGVRQVERALDELQRRTERQTERVAGLEREKRGARSDFISQALSGDLPPSREGARIGGADVLSDLVRRAGLTPPEFSEIGGPIEAPDFDEIFREEFEKAMAETINPETGQSLTADDLIASSPEAA